MPFNNKLKWNSAYAIMDFVFILTSYHMDSSKILNTEKSKSISARHFIAQLKQFFFIKHPKKKKEKKNMHMTFFSLHKVPNLGVIVIIVTPRKTLPVKKRKMCGIRLHGGKTSVPWQASAVVRKGWDLRILRGYRK